MNKRQNKEQDLNIINPHIHKEKRTLEGPIWVMPLVIILIVCIFTIGIVLKISYEKTQSKLELDTNNINKQLDDEFNIAINSINLNGYMEVFEQYMKTSSNDAESSIYFNSATKTLDNITNISDNIVSAFMISFKNKDMVLSGINNDIIEDYDYNSQKWYNYKKITENKMYVSKGFSLKSTNNKNLFAIVRPIVDSMNDEPLGVIAFCYEEDYLQRFFDKTKDNKIETTIYTEDGIVLLNTSNININSIVDKSRNDYLSHKVINSNLNWSVETYKSYVDIVFDVGGYLLIVIIMFGVLIYVYCNLIRQLCKIKVIANRDNIIEKNEKEIPKEEKIEIVKEELTIDEVLNSDEDISIFDEDDEVIVAGEIIYNKK